MPRLPRPQHPDALYHVTLRGVRSSVIYVDDVDRVVFLSMLDQAIEKYGWELVAYCLMDNHFHLYVRTPVPNIACGMQWLNACYAQWFNRRHGTSGHVFERRYRSILVDSDAQALELYRYVVLNPVRAGLVDDAAEWPWSSYAATIGDVEPGVTIRVDCALGLFAPDPGAARLLLRAFVADGVATGSDPVEIV